MDNVLASYREGDFTSAVTAGACGAARDGTLNSLRAANDYLWNRVSCAEGLLATSELELRRELELHCRLQAAPQLTVAGPLPQPRLPLPLPPSATPQLHPGFGTSTTQPHPQDSGRLGLRSQLTWRYWAGGSYVRGRSRRASETPQSSPQPGADADADACIARGNPAAYPSAPPACQHHQRASGAEDCQPTNAINVIAVTTNGSIKYAWATPPAAGRYSCPGVAAAPGHPQPQPQVQLGEVEVATPSHGGSHTSTGGGGGDRCPSPAGGGGGGGQRRSRSLLQLVPLSQSLMEDDQSLRRLQQQLYMVASPFASAAAAAVVDEQQDGEAGAGCSAQRLPQQSSPLPGYVGGAMSSGSGAAGAEPPIIAAYSCAASLSLSLALMDEGDCEAGSAYGWLYSSDDEDYPSRATTARSQCFPSPSPACNANSITAKPRATPPRATSSTASGASGHDLAQQLQSPLPGPHRTAADTKGPPHQVDQPPHHALQPQHRRRHRNSAPGRSSWCGWRSRPLPQPVPEDPAVALAPVPGTDDRTRNYRQQAASALSLGSPPPGVATGDVTAAGGGCHGGVNTAVASVVRNMSAPTLNVNLAACSSGLPPTKPKKHPQPRTGTDAAAGSELLTLLSLWS